MLLLRCSSTQKTQSGECFTKKTVTSEDALLVWTQNVDFVHYLFHWMAVKKRSFFFHRLLAGCVNLKGITSRIRWLLFVNATFIVGPSSPGQSFWWSHVLTIWQLVATFLIPPLTPCSLLLAGGYAPLHKGWRPEESKAQQNKKIQAEGRSLQIQTHFSGSYVMTERDYFCLYLWKSHSSYLKENNTTCYYTCNQLDLKECADGQQGSGAQIAQECVNKQVVCIVSVPLPRVDRRTPVDPADGDVFSELPSVIPAAGYVEVCLLPQGGAQRLHGLWRDLHHQPIWNTDSNSVRHCRIWGKLPCQPWFDGIKSQQSSSFTFNNAGLGNEAWGGFQGSIEHHKTGPSHCNKTQTTRGLIIYIKQNQETTRTITYIPHLLYFDTNKRRRSGWTADDSPVRVFPGLLLACVW